MKWKISDIQPGSLVVFRKHNGKGRKITYRCVFVDDVLKWDNNITIYYDTFSGRECEILQLQCKKYQPNFLGKWEIVDIRYFKQIENTKGELVDYYIYNVKICENE